MEKANLYLDEGYVLMSEFGFPALPSRMGDAVVARAAGALGAADGAAEIAAAFQAFFISRKLFDIGGGDDRARVLLADYFSGLAVKLLSTMRNDRVIRSMSERLKSEAAARAFSTGPLDLDEYLDWTGRVCEEFVNGGTHE